MLPVPHQPSPPDRGPLCSPDLWVARVVIPTAEFRVRQFYPVTMVAGPWPFGRVLLVMVLHRRQIACRSLQSGVGPWNVDNGTWLMRQRGKNQLVAITRK